MNDDAAFTDFMNAREAALCAAVGNFVVDNVSAENLKYIVNSCKDPIVVFAASIALFQVYGVDTNAN